MPSFEYNVTVETGSVNQAIEVMANRLNFDDEYGFYYQINWAERQSDSVIISLLEELARQLEAKTEYTPAFSTADREFYDGQDMAFRSSAKSIREVIEKVSRRVMA